MRDPVKNAGRGLLMGSADLVPGISGGTVALILGIHPRLVQAIAGFDRRIPRDLWRAARSDDDARWRVRRVDLPFIVPLILGMGAAIVVGSQFMEALLHDHPRVAMALFTGLIVGSLSIPYRRVDRPRPLSLLSGFGLAAVIVVIPGFAWPTAWWGLVAAGFIAFTAMLLPGISGSGLLVLLGVYEPILAAASRLDVAVLIPFAVGGAGGLALISRVLTWFFRVHPGATWSFLTGLLAGSVARVWPWRDQGGFGQGLPQWPDGLPLEVLAALVVGIMVPWTLEKIAGNGRPGGVHDGPASG